MTGRGPLDPGVAEALMQLAADPELSDYRVAMIKRATEDLDGPTVGGSSLTPLRPDIVACVRKVAEDDVAEQEFLSTVTQIVTDLQNGR